MDANIDIRVEWHGPAVMRTLNNNLRSATIAATREYYVTLKKLLDKWGSVREFVHNTVPVRRNRRIIALRRTKRILGNMRRRLVHSVGGQPPRRQTGNLYESIRWNVRRPTGSTTLGNYIGTIWTDVPYAPELEYGGAARNYSMAAKKYTRERLINPLRKKYYFIAARPGWRIAFQQSVHKMLAHFSGPTTLFGDVTSYSEDLNIT